MVGAILGGWFQDRVGRKVSLSTASIVAAMGIAVMFACYIPDEVLTRRALFLAGKLVQGLGIGMMMATAQTYSKPSSILAEQVPEVLQCLLHELY